MASKMFTWTQHPSFRSKGDLANQIQRATLSISNNIAEGFERGTTNELLNFLYIARGSSGEVRSMLCVLERMKTFDDLKSEISDLKSSCESVSRQIRGRTNSLQNSDIDIEGQRHLNDRTKGQYESQKRKEAFNVQRRQWQVDLEARLKAEATERRKKVEGEEI